MPAPRELQAWFAAALAGQPPAAFLDVLAGDPPRAQRGLAAYQRSVLANRVGALAASYPVVERIVGEDCFRGVARAYAQARPSHSGDLNDYGADFADFLHHQPVLAALAYLPDVARMEWCVQAAALAAEPVSPDFSVLQTGTPEQWNALRFVTDPSARCLVSPWPLARIWAVNQPGHDGDPRVDFTVASPVLIQRRGGGLRGQVVVEAVSPALAAFAGALIAAESLTDALSVAQAHDPSFDLALALEGLIRAGVLRRAYLTG